MRRYRECAEAVEEWQLRERFAIALLDMYARCCGRGVSRREARRGEVTVAKSAEGGGFQAATQTSEHVLTGGTTAAGGDVGQTALPMTREGGEP